MASTPEYIHLPKLGKVKAIRLRGIGLQPAAHGKCIRTGDTIVCHWGQKYRVKKVEHTTKAHLHIVPYGGEGVRIHTVPFAKLIGITPGTFQKMYRRYRAKYPKIHRPKVKKPGAYVRWQMGYRAFDEKYGGVQTEDKFEKEWKGKKVRMRR